VEMQRPTSKPNGAWYHTCVKYEQRLALLGLRTRSDWFALTAGHRFQAFKVILSVFQVTTLLFNSTYLHQIETTTIILSSLCCGGP
jgi:hypothetical protein